MPFSALKQLSSESFCSGETLARTLGLSRASVHNQIERARSLGIAVHAVRGMGYRLALPCSWLDDSRLNADAPPGFYIQLHQVLESTNNALLTQAQRGQFHKHVLVSEWQSGGRGRRGRNWISPLGGGLTFSVLWRFNRPLTALSGLSLAVGVALVRGLRALGLVHAGVKWPNDILVGDGKLAGILIETQGDMLSAASAVIGIGLNVRAWSGELGEVSDPVATLEGVLGRHVDRNTVLLVLLAQLDAVLTIFDGQGFAAFQEEWTALHAWHERRVRVLQGNGEAFEGEVQGIDEAGVLLIKAGDLICRVHSGDVSLRLGGST